MIVKEGLTEARSSDTKATVQSVTSFADSLNRLLISKKESLYDCNTCQAKLQVDYR
jgi:hypothetical protein